MVFYINEYKQKLSKYFEIKNHKKSSKIEDFDEAYYLQYKPIRNSSY